MTAPERPSPIPDAYRRVTPCLTVHGAGKALEFYAAVFGATERMRFAGPGGTIVHAEMQIGDSVVMVEDEDPRRGTKAPPAEGLPGYPEYLFIYVEDVDAVIPAPRVTMAEQPVRAGRDLRPQPVADIRSQPDPAVIPARQRT
jgi:PhnB protein